MAIRRREGKKGVAWMVDYYIDGKRKFKTFKTRTEALLEEGAIREAKDKGTFHEKAKVYTATLKELVTRYKENNRHLASYETAKKYWLRNFMEYFGENRLLTTIRYIDLVDYRNHLRQKPTPGGVRSVASINREIACLRHLFNTAVDWEKVKESPFGKGESLLQKEDNERDRFLKKEEIPGLLTECPKHLRNIVICAINTGMDRGELLNLKWSQIRNEYIDLPNYKTRPKRKIPINDDLKELFNEIRREQELRSEYVFTYTAGEDNLKGRSPVRKRKGLAPVPQRILNIKTSFKSACRRAGIDDFRFKDLRHTFASHFVMLGGSMKALQELMGHKSMQMTLRYAHLDQAHKKKAISRLNGLTTPAKESNGNNLVTFSESSQAPTG